MVNSGRSGKMIQIYKRYYNEREEHDDYIHVLTSYNAVDVSDVAWSALGLDTEYCTLHITLSINITMA
ncbi:hypothetical protein FRX31_033541 [Thalictrum thalictroides]|uniref:Uncharacterized protein n=1 Tax=Thalictrum thalictroides TaxID=46969 RepID=A0A7J6UW82_THATH|nr:hypothetical protein FRX31_033541 [Thalictrum thalictroides]